MLRKRAATFSGILLLSALLSPFSVKSEQLGQPLQINLEICEPCSLVTFVDTISGRFHTTTWVKDWYFKKRDSTASHELKEKDKSVCRSYRVLMDGDENRYDFKDQTGRQLDLDQEIISLASRSSSLSELLEKLKGILNEADYQSLKSVYEYFEPQYRELLWKPRLKSLEQQLAEFKQQSVESKLSERLGRVQRFMKAPWVPGLPFTVVLVPLPGQGRNTHGESLGAVQIVEVLPGSKFSEQSDVVFHEDCHSLWHSRKDLAEVQKMFDRIEHGRHAYDELNEGMATALGQGWFMKEAFGKTGKSWYMDKTINTYAHALFPLFADYLKNNSSMDSEFARKACGIFNKCFPNAADKIMLTSSYEILADAIPDMSAFKEAVNKALPRLHDSSVSAPFVAEESIKTFKEDRSERKAVLLSLDKLDQLSLLGIPGEQIAVLKRTTRQPVTLKIGDTLILFCVADSFDKQQRMLFSVLSKEKWPAVMKDVR